ncbi:MAG: RNA-binding protein [Bacteroidales bacterium]
MGAAGNKKPKKEKTAKHEKHVPAYERQEAKSLDGVLNKKK